ncbi:hypothetical protein MEO41_28650, partial [Dolichospermum sp. ST_sed4]|nr:hypothetical protein [Dolichospermum sp. ST_sed4]
QYSLPIGNKTVTLNAYDAPTGGNLLAQRIQNVTIIFGQTATLTATLGSSISDSGFTPQTITIPKGSSLMWLNNGTTNHTVTQNPSGFNSLTIAPNGSWSNTFNTASTFNYKDSFN